MKKLMAVCFVGSLLTVGAAWAQDSSTAAPQTTTPSAQTPPATPSSTDAMGDMAKMKSSKVTGKISDDGKTFVSDTDSKSWTIDNPDAVKGHEGHHVTLMAQVDTDKSAVHVKSLKMAK